MRLSSIPGGSRSGTSTTVLDARAGDQKNSVLSHSEPFHDSAIIAVLNEHGGVVGNFIEDANERPDYRGG